MKSYWSSVGPNSGTLVFVFRRVGDLHTLKYMCAHKLRDRDRDRERHVINAEIWVMNFHVRKTKDC